jgi:hypothetical protein
MSDEQNLNEIRILAKRDEVIDIVGAAPDEERNPAVAQTRLIKDID